MEFGFVKRSDSNELGGHNDFHRLYQVSYSTYKIHKTPSYMTRKVVKTQLSIALLHNSNTNKGSKVESCAIIAETHEKCKNVIGGDTFAPSYEGPFKLRSFIKSKSNSTSLCKWNWDVYRGSLQVCVLSKPLQLFLLFQDCTHMLSNIVAKFDWQIVIYATSYSILSLELQKYSILQILVSFYYHNLVLGFVLC